MIGLIKKILGGAGREEEAYLGLGEAERLVKERLSKAIEASESRISSIKEELRKGIRRADESIRKLEAAELQNPNVPPKALHFMEGNRASYIKKARLIVHGKLAELPEDRERLAAFCEDFQEEINAFLKGTQKSYQILQEFFAHESGQLAHDIRGFEKAVADIKKALWHSDIEMLEELLGLISEIRALKKRRKEQAKEILTIEAGISGKAERLGKVARALDAIQLSSEFAGLKELKKKVIGENESARKLEYEVTHCFSVIEKALKKYSRIALERQELIEGYIADPVKAFLNDRRLGILDVLASLRINVEKDSLNLERKKQEKTLKAIGKMNRDFFERVRKGIEMHSTEAGRLAEKIAVDPTNTAFLRLMREKDGLEREIAADKENLAAAKKNLEPDNAGSLSSRLQEKFRKAFGEHYSVRA